MKLAAEAFLDIETLPTDDAELIADIASEISPPKNYKKADTIAAWMANERPALIEEELSKTALDGTYGRVCAIGYALDDEPPIAIVGPEEPVIRDFFVWASSMESAKVPLGADQHAEYGIEITWIGHNIRSFDLRFLWQRAVVLGIAVPQSLKSALAARWLGRELQDTMLMWNPAPDRRVSLERLCRVLRIACPKADMDGSMVAQVFAAGQLERINAYVKADVTAMRACYRRLTGGAANG